MSFSAKDISPAAIEWRDETPYSTDFGDLYFSHQNGIAETQYVFIEQNHLQQRFSAADGDRFTIGETGFGTGLNFFCVAQLWLQCRQRQQASPASRAQSLHFISVEKHPLTPQDLARFGAFYPQFNALLTELLAQYPQPVAGCHRLYFPSANITLSLLFGDSAECLQQWDGQVDAWFLDGFSPALNPQMWCPELFAAIAKLSGPGTTFATFTSAGLVRRGLQAQGFRVEKVAGFGRKREMLRGQLEAAEPQPQALPPEQKPWFEFPWQQQRKQPVQGRSVAVLGAGLAGCSVARALAQRGMKVQVFERASQIATQGSGNPTGMTFTKLSLSNSAQNRFYQGAFLHSCRRIRQLFVEHGIAEGEGWQFNGVVQLPTSDKEADVQQQILAANHWPQPWLQQWLQQWQQPRLQELDTKDSPQLGDAIPGPGLVLASGGWLVPKLLCETLLDHPNIQLHLATAVDQLVNTAQGWQLDDNPDRFFALVIANGLDCPQFNASQWLPARRVRGQITYVPATAESQKLQHAINYDGYITPAVDGQHTVGATFTPKITSPELLPEDHQWNIKQLQQRLPELAALTDNLEIASLAGRVGFRCQTPDYLPLIGPLPDADYFESEYADLGKGFLKRNFPKAVWQPNLFVTSGHGSRGITSAPLAAEIIASYITGEPQVIDRAVLQAVNPARFLVRDIIRRRKETEQNKT